jgi:hypothetical protein
MVFFTLPRGHIAIFDDGIFYLIYTQNEASKKGIFYPTEF